MSLLKEARDAARSCVDIIKRRVLIERCDELRDVLGQFSISCEREDMIRLVSAWTRVLVALNNLPPLPEHGPNGGRQSLPAKKKDVEISNCVG